MTDTEPAISGDQTLEAATSFDFPIVGIGASAGGLDAVIELLSHVPADAGIAVVFVSHLDPSEPSSLAQILARTSKLEVSEIKDGATVERNNVYVIPPNAYLEICGGVFRLSERQPSVVPFLPIDRFLESLAEELGSCAVGVILSGSGSDGTLGIQAIKGEGGITFAQDSSARYDSMPRNAIAGGHVDFILSPRKIAEEIVAMRARYCRESGSSIPELPAASSDESLQSILAAVQRVTGLDFSNYKSGTVGRRIQRRMQIRRVGTLTEYASCIREHPEEVEALSDDLLIIVTRFFRDPDAFEYLKTDVFPEMLRGREMSDPIRIWVPGCATGEELYSLAICFLDAQEHACTSVPIRLFGTDVSESAIQKARNGRFTEGISADVSYERLQRYFSKIPGGYQISKSIREECIFARHDVTRDPPFSRMDLVSCRNLLIYFTPALQKSVLRLFHYALRPAGTLLLGSSEGIASQSNLFSVVSETHKIYSRKATTAHVSIDFTSFGGRDPLREKRKPLAPNPADLQREADRVVLSEYGPPGVIINEGLEILQVRGETGEYLRPAPGAASWSILKMARQGLGAELERAIAEAQITNRRTRREGVLVSTNGKFKRCNLIVSPLQSPDLKGRHFLVLFERGVENAPTVTERHGDEADAAELSSLRSELLDTRNSLQSTIEKLESSNEELSTVNDELKRRNEDANRLNYDLTNLMANMNVGVLMLDRSLRVRRFTPLASELFNLIESDLGRSIEDLRLKLDIPDLKNICAEVIMSGCTENREVRTENGEWHLLAVKPYRTGNQVIEGVVVSVLNIDSMKRSEQTLRETERRLRAILDNAAEGIITMDERGMVQSFNLAAERLFGYHAAEVIGRDVSMLMPAPSLNEHAQYPANDLTTGVEKMIGAGREVMGRRKDGSTFPLMLAVSEVQETTRLFTGILTDLSALHRARERALQIERLAAIGELSAGLEHESRNALQRSQACLEMLAHEVRDMPAAVDLVSRVQKAQDLLLKLYEEVHSYSVPLALKRERFDLRELVGDAWEGLEGLRAGRKIEFRVDFTGGDPICMVDGPHIGRVFQNILENALQSASEPVHIEVIATQADLHGSAAIRLAFRNEGPPLTIEQKERIFDAFYTTKTSGSGLGMAIAKRIVEAHNGTIEVGADHFPGVEILVTVPKSGY